MLLTPERTDILAEPQIELVWEKIGFFVFFVF